MTTDHLGDDRVVLGAPPSRHTHRTWVAHSRPGFIGRANEVRHADALPIHDTAPNPTPSQKVATPVAIGPAPHSVTANNHAAALPGPRFNPMATAAVSIIVATLVSAAALALIVVAGSRAGTSGLVVNVALGAASLSGLALIVAAWIEVGGQR